MSSSLSEVEPGVACPLCGRLMTIHVMYRAGGRLGIEIRCPKHGTSVPSLLRRAYREKLHLPKVYGPVPKKKKATGFLRKRVVTPAQDRAEKRLKSAGK